jgi:hypothetical protein
MTLSIAKEEDTIVLSTNGNNKTQGCNCNKHSDLCTCSGRCVVIRILFNLKISNHLNYKYTHKTQKKGL